MPIPGGRLHVIPIEAEVAVEQNLVRLKGSGRQVVADLAENQVEVTVPPEVIAGKLLGEDLAERRPEVAQLVRALQRNFEREESLDAPSEVIERAQLAGAGI